MSKSSQMNILWKTIIDHDFSPRKPDLLINDKIRVDAKQSIRKKMLL